VWSLRLTGYIFRDRVLRAAHEDGRYQKLRRQWGSKSTRNFFIFFQAQGVLAFLLSIPFLVAAQRSGPLDAADIAGALFWLTGIIGESIADAQLASFRRDPANRGRTCRIGLWRYSRHPNYFFEWLMWCSYATVASGPVFGWSWLTWLAPCVMLALICFVTGIPPTEARAIETRGDDYRDYQRTTSAFFPWFPRSSPVAERSL
jgi:steroid 5-alpha reductase family enzyme